MTATHPKPTVRVAALNLPTPPPAPQLKPKRATELTEHQGRRLLLNQLLVSHLETNTQALIDEGSWPAREDKLVTAVGHRIGELYDRYFERNGPEESDWFKNVIGLSEGATISIVALAVEGNPIKTARLAELLTQLAQLAGTYQQ